MSDVPRHLLRAGVERSRRFVMLPSFGLSLPGLDWLSSRSWIWFRDASRLELIEEWIENGGLLSVIDLP